MLLWVGVSLIALWHRHSLLHSIILCLPWLFLLGYFTFFNRLNLGLRYILPVYPFWCMISAAPLHVYSHRWRKSCNWILTGCLLWSLIVVFRIYPHYLAYFNELVGGPARGYHFLVDSNLDWGQDLKNLKKYMTDRRINHINLSYFGCADPSYYGINYDYFPSPRFQPWTSHHQEPDNVKFSRGIYAISATNLQGTYLKDRDIYAVFRHREPKDNIGYSILIYSYP